MVATFTSEGGLSHSYTALQLNYFFIKSIFGSTDIKKNMFSKRKNTKNYINKTSYFKYRTFIICTMEHRKRFIE
jgi:hypothetical protein